MKKQIPTTMAHHRDPNPAPKAKKASEKKATRKTNAKEGAVVLKVTTGATGLDVVCRAPDETIAITLHKVLSGLQQELLEYIVFKVATDKKSSKPSKAKKA